MKRPRTNLCVPRTPGGFMDLPPTDCPHSQTYCPDPKRYETILVTNRIICPGCKFAKGCVRKAEEDRGRRRRISQQRTGGE